MNWSTAYRKLELEFGSVVHTYKIRVDYNIEKIASDEDGAIKITTEIEETDEIFTGIDESNRIPSIYHVSHVASAIGEDAPSKSYEMKGMHNALSYLLQRHPKAMNDVGDDVRYRSAENYNPE